MCKSKKVKKKKSSAEKYWTQVVKDYFSCFDTRLPTKRVDHIVQRLLDDDFVWSTIESAIDEYAKEEI